MGVFVGQCNYDFAELFSFGGGGGLCANRVSFVLGLKGPSFLVDTACSSSLLASDCEVHYMRTGDCALLGGVNEILAASVFMKFVHQ